MRSVPRRTALNAALAVLALALLAVGSTLLLGALAPELTEPAALADVLLGFGPWTPVAFVALQAGQVLLAPIPGQVVAFVGGYLFGAVPGTVYSLLGVTLGSAAAFSLARRYGRPWVGRIVGPGTLDRLDTAVGSDGRVVVFLLFLVPGMPDDAICFVAGLTDIPIRVLVAIAVVGRAPSVFLVSVSGASLAADRLVVFVAVAVALIGLSVVGYLSRHRLVAALAK
jgi:uncharacterized membrane protein YdjX (TVP38/TMEM64 family)